MNLARGLSVWAVVITWAGLAPAVTAPQAEAEAARGYSLQYRAAASCPEASELARAIESRTPGARQQAPEAAAVQLRVELRDDGTSTLWLDLPEGGSRREFPRANCTDTVASIALIAAMVLEADASERAATAQSIMAPAASEAAYPAPSASPGVAQSPTATPLTAAPLAPRPPPAHDLAPSVPASRWGFALVAGALLESAVASGAPLGASAGVAASLEPGRPRWWLLSLQLEALATLPATVEASRGDVELGLVAGRLHLCPLRLPVGSRLRLVPCLTGDAGVLRARGTGRTSNPRARSMPWLALGGTVRAQLMLGRAVGLESWLGLRGLARADTFVFGDPDSRPIPAYQVPSWSLGAGLGLTFALP